MCIYFIYLSIKLTHDKLFDTTVLFGQHDMVKNSSYRGVANLLGKVEDIVH